MRRWVNSYDKFLRASSPFDPHHPRTAINLISAIIQLHELPFNILSSMLVRSSFRYHNVGTNYTLLKKKVKNIY